LTSSSSRKEFFFGVRAELPILIGVVPFGMIYGVLAIGAGLPPLAAQAMSAIVFAGSAQFLATGLYAAGAPGMVIVLTTGVVNLRHALYSASIAPYTRRLSLAWKGLLAYLLTDEAYAVTITHYLAGGIDDEAIQYKHWFFLGAGLALWSAWQASTAVGILMGSVIPSSWSLDFTLALTFIALVVPNIKDWAGLLAALAAGVTAVLAAGLPYKLGLVVASLVGITVGMLVEGWRWRSG
jgi:4-azaleucine resistance transporter AzlC